MVSEQLVYLSSKFSDCLHAVIPRSVQGAEESKFMLVPETFLAIARNDTGRLHEWRLMR